jgi:hypothetical protein
MATTTTTPLTAARAEALFTSQLSTGSHPAYDVVEEAIRIAVRAHGGVRGCAGDVAAEYGDHPELAVPRMRWARDVVDHLYEFRRLPAVTRAPRRVCEPKQGVKPSRGPWIPPVGGQISPRGGPPARRRYLVTVGFPRDRDE